MWALPGNSGGEHDGATLSNILASIFNSGQRCPIAQLKSMPGFCKVRLCKLIQLQRVAGSEDQVIQMIFEPASLPPTLTC